MSNRLILLFLLAGTAWTRSQDSGEDKKARQEKLRDLRKSAASADESVKLKAIEELGGIEDEEAVSILGGKLKTDTEGVRISAAKALARHRRPSSVKAIAAAVGINAALPEVLGALIRALGDLDMCEGIPVLVKTMGLQKYALAEEALKALQKIGCSECAPALVTILRQAETEAKKPDMFEGGDTGDAYADPAENKQKNKALAGLVSKIREVLSASTGETFATSAEWAAALSSGKVSLKRKSVYLCTLNQETFEVSSGKAKKCPHDDGKKPHEDVFLKHVRE